MFMSCAYYGYVRISLGRRMRTYHCLTLRANHTRCSRRFYARSKICIVAAVAELTLEMWKGQHRHVKITAHSDVFWGQDMNRCCCSRTYTRDLEASIVACTDYWWMFLDADLS